MQHGDCNIFHQPYSVVDPIFVYECRKTPPLTAIRIYALLTITEI